MTPVGGSVRSGERGPNSDSCGGTVSALGSVGPIEIPVGGRIHSGVHRPTVTPVGGSVH